MKPLLLEKLQKIPVIITDICEYPNTGCRDFTSCQVLTFHRGQDRMLYTILGSIGDGIIIQSFYYFSGI